MPRITETVVTTLDADGRLHAAPMGLIDAPPDRFVLAPFRPSQTLDNLRRDGRAVVNLLSDVRVFAGCICGRRDWPSLPALRIEGRFLTQAQSHRELVVERVEDDPQRPRFVCRQRHFVQHAPFLGFNRAQAAVIEGAVLISRLRLLDEPTIRAGMTALTSAIEKTAGPEERQAWDWLVAKMDAFYTTAPAAPAAAGHHKLTDDDDAAAPAD